MTKEERKKQLIQSLEKRIGLCKEYIQIYPQSTYNEQRRERMRELETELVGIQRAHVSLSN